jgi:hypothetical protein
MASKLFSQLALSSPGKPGPSRPALKNEAPLDSFSAAHSRRIISTYEEMFVLWQIASAGPRPGRVKHVTGPDLQ